MVVVTMIMVRVVEVVMEGVGLSGGSPLLSTTHHHVTITLSYETKP